MVAAEMLAVDLFEDLHGYYKLFHSQGPISFISPSPESQLSTFIFLIILY